MFTLLHKDKQGSRNRTGLYEKYESVYNYTQVIRRAKAEPALLHGSGISINSK